MDEGTTISILQNDAFVNPPSVFLDDQGNIMCILEVWYTHKKSLEDLEKIKQYKIITSDYNIHFTREMYAYDMWM